MALVKFPITVNIDQMIEIDGIPTVFLMDANGKLFSSEASGKRDTLIPLLLKKVQWFCAERVRCPKSRGGR